jgi:hypothetical protein
VTKPKKAPSIIIPVEHQSCPKEDPIKTRYKRKTISGIFLPESTISDTDLRSGLAVASSIIHGLGLFADKTFTQHNIVWRERLTGVIGKPEDDGPLRWTNHSDDPNCVLLIDLEKVEVGLVALKSIKIGAEITYNYKDFGHTGYKARCNCSQLNCPGYFTLREEWGERK